MYIALGIILLLSLMLFYFSWSISLGVYLKSVCKNPKAGNKIALTFDDGVDEILTPKVLAVLDKYSVKATFFIIGEKAMRNPEIVRQIVERGHEIGNHSMWHKATFPMQSTKAILKEIETCSDTLQNIIGKEIKYFRPPFGVTNPMIGKAVRKSRLMSIGWSIRSLDTVGNSTETVKKRVLSKVKNGDIVLLHDNRKNADLLLEEVLQGVAKLNLKAVTINELLK